MARYTVSIATPLAPAEAFAFMADVTRFPEWDPGVRRAVRVQGDGASVGSSYALTVHAGTTSVMTYTVTRHEPPQRLVLVARTAFLTSEDTITVAAATEGSVVTYDAVLTLRGALGGFDPLLRRAFNRIGGRAAEGLRRALRGTRVTP